MAAILTPAAALPSYEDDTAIPTIDNDIAALAAGLQQRYNEERDKRLRPEGNEQYTEISLSEKFYEFIEDPWVDPANVKDIHTMFPDQKCHMLILGAGWGGLLYAVRMVEAGVDPKDIRIVDTAGGWGGAWYWNRYPGLTCDIESYIYLPLLEETGYIPKQRYSSGEEVRLYAELVAKKYGLDASTVFQTKANAMTWNEAAKYWSVDLVQHRTGALESNLNVQAQFVATVNGVFNWPKLPNVPGNLGFGGKMFHTSRWDYNITGGSPDIPDLSKLKDKRVALIGTGATSVQILPHLAASAKHVYVVQRTPASVDEREQRKTDEEWFKRNVANKKGWQKKRITNFNAHLTTGRQPDINLVDDPWTKAAGMVPIAGNPCGPKSMAEVPQYVDMLRELDAPRQERLRKRVDDIVKDSKTAENLKSWYPTWCKRPTFSSTYLEAFNNPNVTLLHSLAGLERLTPTSIVVDGKSHEVDVIILATGFRAPFIGSPAQKANMTIVGKDAKDMAHEWHENGPSTLHGVLDTNFPNLFLSGPWQAALSPNYLPCMDALATHAAYIYATAKSQAKGDAKFSLRATREGTNDWAHQVLIRCPPGAAMAGCTPSFFNVEGAVDKIPHEGKEKFARSGLWGYGLEDFKEWLEGWRKEGRMEGVEVNSGCAGEEVSGVCWKT